MPRDAVSRTAHVGTVGTNGCLDASMAHGRNPFIMLNNMKYIEARRFHHVLFCFICKLNFKNEHLLNDSGECTFSDFCPYPPYKKKTALSQVRICLSPSHEKWPSLHKRCVMCWNEWKIMYRIFPIFNFWVIVARELTIRLQKKLFKSGQIFRKDEDWSDNDFLVRELFLHDS